MNITETKLKGCFLVEPELFKDNRGVFFEVFRKDELDNKLGYEINFIQENQSISKKGVLRGLHFQKGSAAQAKLVNVVQGEVLDVVVDLRPESETFGQHVKIRLSGENHKSLFIPKGLAHGFLALSDKVIFSYKCDAYYDPEMEAGIFFNDQDLGIDWEYPFSELIISDKDRYLTALKAFVK
ncbi:MAG: dTDP-4-dehydrorhamnose 3,5-epimerase [Maribacter sp.]